MSMFTTIKQKWREQGTRHLCNFTQVYGNVKEDSKHRFRKN